MSRDALVVGINSYQDERLPNLTAPAEDAEAIAKILERHGDFKVWRLPEAIDSDKKTPYVGKKSQVALAQLKKALVQLFKPEGKQYPDTALFYFSGHGLRSTLGIQEGFLATSDIDSKVLTQISNDYQEKYFNHCRQRVESIVDNYQYQPF